jgi:hypothetical protein
MRGQYLTHKDSEPRGLRSTVILNYLRQKGEHKGDQGHNVFDVPAATHGLGTRRTSCTADDRSDLSMRDWYSSRSRSTSSASSSSSIRPACCGRGGGRWWGGRCCRAFQRGESRLSRRGCRKRSCVLCRSFRSRRRSRRGCRLTKAAPLGLQDVGGVVVPEEQRGAARVRGVMAKFGRGRRRLPRPGGGVLEGG